jgi:hypothetical protein
MDSTPLEPTCAPGQPAGVRRKATRVPQECRCPRRRHSSCTQRGAVCSWRSARTLSSASAIMPPMNSSLPAEMDATFCAHTWSEWLSTRVASPRMPAEPRARTFMSCRPFTGLACSLSLATWVANALRM